MTPFERHGGWIRVVLLVSVLVVAPFAVVDVAGGASEPAPARAVFEGGDGDLHVVTADDTVVDLGVSADTVGRLEPLDSDEYLEAPFVVNGALKAVDVTGETQTLVGSGVKATPIGVGDLDGDAEIAVFYANSNGKLVQYENGTTTKLRDADDNTIATGGALGVADYDGDGDRDLVFIGSSDEIRYYNGSVVESTGFSSYGNNNGVGVGTPADFDGDGTIRVPYVGSSGETIKFLASNGTTTRSIDPGVVEKTQIGPAEWDGGNSALEVLYVDGNEHTVRVAYLNGTSAAVTDSGGKTITAVTAIGVAGAVKPPAPEITNYSVTNPGGREVHVTFDASADLTNVSVETTGAESATLTEGDFNETGTGPYHYEGTYVGSVDGNYTATLVTAEGPDGYDGADGQNGTVSVETPSPTVTNATVTDVTDGNGVVAGGDEVRVTATVNHTANLTSVIANASAFGVGNVTLHETSADVYEATFTVDGSAVPADGERRARVVATNEYDHRDRNATGTLFVDTTRPVADAGQNRTVKEDTEVGFDGDGSTDNGEVARYVWQFGDGANATGVTATHTYADPGTYTVELTVYDTAGHADTDTKTVTVTDVTDSGGSPGGTTSGGGETTDTDGGTTDTTSGTSGTETTGGTSDTTSNTSDVNDGGSTDTTSTADDRALRTNVSVPEPDLVRVAIYHAAAGRQVALDLPATNATTRTGGGLAAIGVETNRPGNVSFAVRVSSDAPDGATRLATARSAAALTYFEIGGNLSDAAVTDPALTFAVEREALGPRDPDDVAVYRPAGDGWRRLGAAIVNRSAETIRYRVRPSELSVFALGVRQPSIRIADVALRDGVATVGDTAVVAATLENQGVAEGTKTVALAVAGTTVEVRNVTLAANETERVTFTHALDEPGEHAVSLSGERVGTIEVEQSGSSDSMPRERASMNGDHLSLIVVLLALLIGSIGVREQLR